MAALHHNTVATAKDLHQITVMRYKLHSCGHLSVPTPSLRRMLWNFLFKFFNICRVVWSLPGRIEIVAPLMLFEYTGHIFKGKRSKWDDFYLTLILFLLLILHESWDRYESVRSLTDNWLLVLSSESILWLVVTCCLCKWAPSGHKFCIGHRGFSMADFATMGTFY